MNKSRASKEKKKPAKAAPARPSPAVPAAPLPPLFRRLDWLASLLAFGTVWIIYFLTLAPEQTLEDSGELCTGAFYAGIPHPPGYPFWTVYAWLWTKLLPWGNVAWRVEVGEATAAAMACGLAALMVSRGSSMIIEGIVDLKNIERRWENSLCLASGFVAGMLIGFNGFMWSQAVIVEVYTLSVLSLTGVLACMMRWIYAPHQWRYLCMAFFWYGICFNNHQSLLVIIMGMEIGIIAVSPR
jgi:hypothetical protein